MAPAHTMALCWAHGTGTQASLGTQHLHTRASLGAWHWNTGLAGHAAPAHTHLAGHTAPEHAPRWAHGTGSRELPDARSQVPHRSQGSRRNGGFHAGTKHANTPAAPGGPGQQGVQKPPRNSRPAPKRGARRAELGPAQRAARHRGR